MVVQLIASSLMTSDRTRHQARCVGEGWWEASWLRGRKLTAEQAVSAMRVAEETSPVMTIVQCTVGNLVSELGLTPFEALGMAAGIECDWPVPNSGKPDRRWWRHVR